MPLIYGTWSAQTTSDTYFKTTGFDLDDAASGGGVYDSSASNTPGTEGGAYVHFVVGTTLAQVAAFDLNTRQLRTGSIVGGSRVWGSFNNSSYDWTVSDANTDVQEIPRFFQLRGTNGPSDINSISGYTGPASGDTSLEYSYGILFQTGSVQRLFNGYKGERYWYRTVTEGVFSAPTNVTAQSGETRQVTLGATLPAAPTKWQYRQSKTTGGISGATWQDISSTELTVSHAVTGLDQGTTYYFQLRGVDSYGNGTASQTVSATTYAAAPPKPSGVSAAGGNGHISLFASVTGVVTKWQYRRATTFAGVASAAWTDIASTALQLQHTDQSLTNGTTYYYQLRAVNLSGNGDASDIVSATPAAPLAVGQSEFWIRFQDRRNHQAVAQIDNFIDAEFTFNWRSVGAGKIKMQIDQLPRDALSLLVHDNLGVHFHRVWYDGNGEQQVEDWLGFAVGYEYRHDRFLVQSVDFTQVVNEPIMLGATDPDNDIEASRVGYRFGGNINVPPASPSTEQVWRTASKVFHGVREELHDARQFTDDDGAADTTAMQDHWRLYITRGHFAWPNLDSISSAGSASGAQITIHLQDVIGYLGHRVVDTSQHGVIDPGWVRSGSPAPKPDDTEYKIKAERYIYDMLQRELLDPRDELGGGALHGNQAYRKLDVDFEPMPGSVGFWRHGCECSRREHLSAGALGRIYCRR